MTRCAEFLRTKTEDQIRESCFSLQSSLVSEASKENAKWARFYAVLFPEQLTDAANEFWGFLGDGISSRHAVFCLERFSFMDSISTDLSLKTLATSHDIEKMPLEPWNHSDAVTKQEIRTMIAGLVTSQKPNQEAVKTQDVFLYPKGMCAIGSVARQLAPTSSETSEAVVFGCVVPSLLVSSKLRSNECQLAVWINTKVCPSKRVREIHLSQPRDSGRTRQARVVAGIWQQNYLSFLRSPVQPILRYTGPTSHPCCCRPVSLYCGL